MPILNPGAHSSDPRRSVSRALFAIVLTVVIVGGSAPAVAQEATPAATPLADSCATLLTESATPIPTAGGEVAVPAFDEVPIDLLAIDGLSAHHEAVIALTTVAMAGIQEPELRQLAEQTRTATRDEAAALTASRAARFPGAAPLPTEYRTALLDQALAAAGVPAGSGQAPVLETNSSAAFLCGLGATAPFDLAVIDLLSTELQRGVALGLLMTQRAEQDEVRVQGQAVVDRETSAIGQLAIWRDAWFGPGAPLVVALAGDGHDHGA